MTTLEIISLIESDKRKKHIDPPYALVREVEDRASEFYPICTREIIKAEIELLQSDNKIKIGDTINDNYIKII